MLLNSDFIKRYGISGNGLKILALMLMITDHIGAILLPQYRILRYIGRLSFPIYCFLITEGMLHTHNIYKYGIRLLIFAIISEIPFDLAISGQLLEFNDQNVFFTLFLGLVVIYCAYMVNDASKGFAVCIAGMLAAMFLRTDYSAYGVLMIYCFYLFRGSPWLMTVFIGIINLVMGIGGTGSQKYAVLAMIPILLYSGNKSYGESKSNENEAAGKNNIKNKCIQMLFYVIYPLHLVVLYLIKVY